MTKRDHHDLLGGALMATIGLFAFVYGQQYEFGSLGRMGPGFFPISLGAILVVLGFAIAAPAWVRRGERVHVEWRTAALVLGSIVVFALALVHLGLIAATVLTVFLSSLADRNMRWRGRVGLAIAVTLVTVLIFVTGLEMILPLWRWGT